MDLRVFGLLLLLGVASAHSDEESKDAEIILLLQKYLSQDSSEQSPDVPEVAAAGVAAAPPSVASDIDAQKAVLDSDTRGRGSMSPEMERMIDCRGMPCDAWNRTQTNMKRLFDMLYKTKLPDQGSFDLMNHEHGAPDGTFDGCTWLTESQSEALLTAMSYGGRAKRRANRVKRKLSNIVANAFNKWDNKESIQWKFDGQHTSWEQRTIRNAFQGWMDETCMRFQERGINEIVTGSHILVTRKLTGCHSYVGKTSLVPQILNLQGSCVTEFGIPIHEIGHALGLWHEQQRNDRDSTIRILWNNLGYYMGQFAAVNTLNLGVPYDVGSVMHYAPKDGSSTGGDVMATLDPLYQKSMGQKVGMSYYDALIINKAYCADVCRGVQLARACERDGYQDPNNCNICKCPPGFGGHFCENVAPSKGDAQCGGVIDLGSMGGTETIMSPGYDYPGFYQNHQQCNWLIRAPPGGRVELKFAGHFSVYSHTQGQCYHWVEIKYKGSFGLPGPRFCGHARPMETLTSSGEEMLIVFRSNWTVSWGTARGGFKAAIRAVQADGSDINPMDTKTTTTTATTTTTTTTTTTPRPTTIRLTTVPTTTTTTLRTTTGPMLAQNWEWRCNFDTDSGEATSCDMKQEKGDDFDWTIYKGSTPSQYTGPAKAFDRSYYAFIEASSPRKSDDRATLWTPILRRAGAHCVTFYYHMYGFHVRSLRMLKGYTGNSDIVWQKEGQIDQEWHRTDVTVDLSVNDQVGFEAIRGNAFSGDIAIDNIVIRPGSC